MATLKPELKTILERYGIDPRDKSQVWDCHGTLVLYHKAYEIIAAKEGIRFDPPTVIEASSKDKTVSLLVVGHMDNRSEWSIGEAAPGNCKNAYPYAMAEKRAKDRVIAKLVGLAAYVYSEDEADEFKDAKPSARKGGASADPVGVALAVMDGFDTLADLGEFWAANAKNLKRDLSEDDFRRVEAHKDARKAALSQQRAA